MNKIRKERAEEIITNAKNKKIAVVGDVMLDRFFWGAVSRISPEAPVPVIDVESETFHLGGAANVANNLTSLGLKPILFGLLGNDNSGKLFINIANELGIECDGLFADEQRPTTVKTRIIGNNQHIARIDRENNSKISVEGENFILNSIKNNKDIEGIILEDYNKGTLSDVLINNIINYANANDIAVMVDPKHDNFFSYKNVTLFKPNRKEAQNALGKPIKSNEDIINAGKILLEKLNCQNVLITLGAEGMILFESDGTISSVPTYARKVSDVSGAGDTAIATFSAALSGGATAKEAATLANYASGIVVEKPGIISIEIKELLNNIPF